MAIVSWSMQAQADDQTPVPQYPVGLYVQGQSGEVRLDIKFDSGGKASACNVVHSSGSTELDDYTVDFIRHNWQAPKYAGLTVHVPISYEQREYVPRGFQRKDAVPRNIDYDVKSGYLLVRCSFGSNGRIESASIAQSSGSNSIDASTIQYLISHARNLNYANKVIYVPMWWGRWNRTKRWGPGTESD